LRTVGLVAIHASRNVLRQRRRTAIAAGAIAFGVMALILAGAFIEWIFWATREGTIQAGLGHIHVGRSGFIEASSANPQRFRLPAHDALLDELRSDKDVRVVAPRLFFSGLVSRGDTTISFLGEGVDPAAESQFGEASVIIDGGPLATSSPQEIIVGYGMASNLGAKVGDTLVLLTNVPGGGVNAVEARVRGLFATVSKAYDDSVMRVPLRLAAQLTRSEGADRWVVVLKNTAQTRAVLERLRAKHASEGFDFVPWYELADFYIKTRNLLSRQMGVMFVIIGVIIVLTISNSMMMSVLERTSEIGTAMALGVRKTGVLMQFLGEGLVLGMVGGAIGVLIGVGLAVLISAIGIPMPPPPGQARSFTAEMIVTTPLVLQAFGLAVVVALVAALYPAWKASRIPIVDALRRGR